MTNNKNGAPIPEGAAENTHRDSSTTAPLYYPLTWRKSAAGGFRGKGKRSARRAAVERKRGGA